MSKQSYMPENDSGGLLQFIIVLVGIILVFVALYFTGVWDIMSTPDRLFAIFAGLIVFLVLGVKTKKKDKY